MMANNDKQFVFSADPGPIDRSARIKKKTLTRTFPPFPYFHRHREVFTTDSFMFSPVDRHAIITGKSSTGDKNWHNEATLAGSAGKSGTVCRLSEIRTFPGTLQYRSPQTRFFMAQSSWPLERSRRAIIAGWPRAFDLPNFLL